MGGKRGVNNSTSLAKYEATRVSLGGGEHVFYHQEIEKKSKDVNGIEEEELTETCGRISRAARS